MAAKASQHELIFRFFLSLPDGIQEQLVELHEHFLAVELIYALNRLAQHRAGSTRTAESSEDDSLWRRSS